MQRAWALFVFILVSARGFASEPASFINLKNAKINTTEARKVFALDNADSETRFAPFSGIHIYLLQFSGNIKESWKEELAQGGVQFWSYIPNNAFIAEISSDEAWQAVNKSSHVYAVLPYKTEYKMSSDLAVPSVFTADQIQNLAVKLLDPSMATPFISQMAAMGVTLTGSFSDSGFYLSAPVSKINEISSLESVEWVEPVNKIGFAREQFQAATRPFVSSFSDLSGYESGFKLINIDVPWRQGLHGEGEIVGIADSGLDRGSLTEIHDDFKGQVLKGYSLAPFSGGWGDREGHGTHTAGSIIGQGTLSRNSLRGGAYGAKLVVQSIWSPPVEKIEFRNNYERLFGDVYRNDGVRVHSDSWSGEDTYGYYGVMSAALDGVLWKYKDLLVVFASGNSGGDKNKDGKLDFGTVDSPSTAKNCLSVGASKNYVLKGGQQEKLSNLIGSSGVMASVEPLSSTTLSDNANGIAPFSGVGPTKDGRFKPDIVAPGTNILSTTTQLRGAPAAQVPFNSLYHYESGTSMATPIVAAAAVIARQYLKKTSIPLEPSAALVKAVLIHNAGDLYPGQFPLGPKQEMPTRRPNMLEGFGRVDIGAVVNGGYRFIDERMGLSTGEAKSTELGLAKVAKGQNIRATMVYTDAPASPSAETTLVNDLDLVIYDPSGQPHYPNHLSGPDKKNNVEMVEFLAPQDGTYKLVIKGARVPQGDEKGRQPYAIVWSDFR